MITNFTASDIPDQTGKTFFITGANTGLGFESAEAFAGKNGRVLVAVRNPGKGETAIDQTRQEHPGADVQFVRIDLAGLASIRKAAGIVAQEPRLDVLLNNAGVMMNPKTLTKDGFESQFGINHLGTSRSPHTSCPRCSRHRGAESSTCPRTRTEWATATCTGTTSTRSSATARRVGTPPRSSQTCCSRTSSIGDSEPRRPARLRSQRTRAWRTPSSAGTTPGGAKALLVLARPITVLLLNSAESGAWPQELAATHPEVEGAQYFGPSRLGEVVGKAKQVDSSDESKDPQKARRLWDLSIEMTGVDPGLRSL